MPKEQSQQSMQLFLVASLKNLLDVAPLYGSVIMQLPRLVDSHQPAPLGLRWQGHHWYLVLNPQKIQENFTKPDELAQGLAHEALHLIWQHPIRYADSQASKTAVQKGTDVAVNQYLPTALGSLPDAYDLGRVFQEYQKLLKPGLDSAEYIAALKDLVTTSETKSGQPVDSHEGWEDSQGQGVEAGTALDNILRQAKEDVQRTGRGNVPGRVWHHLQEVLAPKQNWRAILKMALAQQPKKMGPTQNRFNRRQPYRMDLPGQRQQNQARLAVFLDNSASVSDHDLGLFTAWLGQISRTMPVDLQVFSFDSEAQPLKHWQNWQRQGGGGTVFQSIFDTLADQHFPKQTTVVIFTDGQGEDAVDSHGYHRVYWVLPPKGELSLSDPAGRVLKMGAS
ncbi:VWA-like domain-containing protein [Leuconostocaceae bacterium ESL0723]|nr:VWA-like domain-containing protein [Leuconostocaceae bacterium ESL0723]